MTNEQITIPKPPLEVGRVYETRQELEELVNAWGLTDANSANCFVTSGVALSCPINALMTNRLHPVFPLPWTLVKMPDVEGVPSDAPLKSFVWVEGNRLPVKSHDTHELAVQEALRLSGKERKRVFVITAVVEPVFTPQIVQL